MTTVFAILASMFAFVIAIFAIIFVAVPLFKGIGWVIANTFKGIGWLIVHIFQYVAGTLRDLVRSVGAVIATIAFVPLVLLNVIIGRWSASAHFGRAVQAEIMTLGHCLYRVVIGHPLRLLLLNGLIEGLEQRVPAAVANAPGSDKPTKRTGTFEGFTIVGSLKIGGSGAKLYVAEPDAAKLAAYNRAGVQDVEQVVIKSFSLRDGSSMPQIVRESRALEAARKLGLVLEHEMTDERFYYIMRYVPGDDLTAVTKLLHTPTGNLGLTEESLREALGYIADLLETLNTFHEGGLWHKDVKPDNIIVHDTRAHLVDFGLVTSLRSGMTLTTHGTEYFRDPELVRMALRGAKVHEVNGEKFDIYGTGAVLFSVIENSFPAHGGLSQITKRCPETLRWIVRRAMTDMNKRYPTAQSMLADVRKVLEAEDPFALRPADLPSMTGEPAESFAAHAAPVAPEADAAAEPVFARQAATSVPPGEQPPVRVRAGRGSPKIRVTDWITGRYAAAGKGVAPASATPGPRVVRAGHSPAHRAANDARIVPAHLRAPAHEQLKSARSRAEAARGRVGARQHPKHRARAGRSAGRYSNQPNSGVIIAVLLLFLGTIVLVVGVALGFALLTPVFHNRSQELFADNTTFINFGDGISVAAGDPEQIRAGTSSRSVSTSNGRTYTVESSEQDLMIAQLMTRLADSYGKPLLIVSDYAPGDEAGIGTLSAIASELVSEGFTVLGLNESDADLEFIARAKKAIGLNQPGDQDARDEIRRWLMLDDAEIGAVLWAHPNEDWQFVSPHSQTSTIPNSDTNSPPSTPVP